VRDALRAGPRREDDRDGAAQPDPPDHGLLADRNAERCEAHEDGERARDHDEERGDEQAAAGHVWKVRREHEQAEHHEHRDLREPRERVVKAEDRAPVDHRS
jgi:hypothetical protein